MEQYECPFQVGDTVIPMRPLNRLEGPNWTGAMDDMDGNAYHIYSIKWGKNGYYLIRIGDNIDERQWIFMDKWLKPVNYTLF